MRRQVSTVSALVQAQQEEAVPVVEPVHHHVPWAWAVVVLQRLLRLQEGLVCCDSLGGKLREASHSLEDHGGPQVTQVAVPSVVGGQTGQSSAAWSEAP